MFTLKSTAHSSHSSPASSPASIIEESSLPPKVKLLRPKPSTSLLPRRPSPPRRRRKKRASLPAAAAMGTRGLPDGSSPPPPPPAALELLRGVDWGLAPAQAPPKTPLLLAVSIAMPSSRSIVTVRHAKRGSSNKIPSLLCTTRGTCLRVPGGAHSVLSSQPPAAGRVGKGGERCAQFQGHGAPSLTWPR